MGRKETDKNKYKVQSGTIFDDAFRTLCEKNSRLIIPIINEIFSKNYRLDDPIEIMNGEHHFMERNSNNSKTNNNKKINNKRVTDSCFMLDGKRYHIECQSNSDGIMIIRMIEYDFLIALDNIRNNDGVYEMEFPHSAVLYLRGSGDERSEMQLNIKFPEKQSVKYSVPQIRVQEYSKENVIGKKLYFLVPFYILRYENEIKNSDRSIIGKIQKDLEDLRIQIIQDGQNDILNEIDVYNIIELTTRIVEYVTRDSDEVREELNEVMGGKVIETMYEKWQKAEERVKEVEKKAEEVEKKAEEVKQNIEQNSKAALVKSLKKLNQPEDVIVGELVENYNLSKDEAVSFVREEVSYHCDKKDDTK